jgi:threonine/homoserine/homoserine lactone efflux protein
LTTNLITISIIGLIAGFIFSMPVAGPVSIIITSNALKGKLRYCNLLAMGASFADFLYVLVAVYGITHLFTLFSPAIPYILCAGSFFIIYIGIRIFRTKFDIEHIDEESSRAGIKGNRERGGLYTGFMINFLNPTLFFGWMVSSFIVLSFAASAGFATGGLASSVDENIEQIRKIDHSITEKPEIPSYLKIDTLEILRKNSVPAKSGPLPSHSHLLISLFYSFFLAAGTVLWFFLLTFLLVRYRKKINISIINHLVQGLGLILCLFGLFFGYSALKLLV